MHTRVRAPLFCFAAALLLVTAPISASAALVQLTYSVSATAFEDSNGDPPAASTSTSVSGTFSFVLDPAETATQLVTPVAVSGFDIRRKDGVLIDFDETNTGVRIMFLHGLMQREIAFGGIFGPLNGPEYTVGQTDPGDFRAVFRIANNDFEVVPLVPVITDFSFLTLVDPSYISRDWSATLISVSAVPEPKLYALIAAGLGLIWLRRVRAA